MKIICVGNLLVDPDNLGQRVYAALASKCLPPGVALIDGGLAGLDLLRFVDKDSLVFVDALQGFGAPGELVLLNRTGLEFSLSAGSATMRYDHGAGLAYLLKVIFELHPFSPELWLVGLEVNGQPLKVGDAERVAEACWQLVENEIERASSIASGGKSG